MLDIQQWFISEHNFKQLLNMIYLGYANSAIVFDTP